MDIRDFDALIFDFDGVLTNNRVFVDEYGNESVCCNRSDGLAFDILKKLEIPTYILSSESNPVVRARANKLNVQVLYGISNKLDTLIKLCSEERYDLGKMFYVGNDLNDFHAMKACANSACPSDSHPLIIRISSVLLDSKGGDGVIRELLEKTFKLDFLKILY